MIPDLAYVIFKLSDVPQHFLEFILASARELGISTVFNKRLESRPSFALSLKFFTIFVFFDLKFFDLFFVFPRFFIAFIAFMLLNGSLGLRILPFLLFAPLFSL